MAEDSSLAKVRSKSSFKDKDSVSTASTSRSTASKIFGFSPSSKARNRSPSSSLTKGSSVEGEDSGVAMDSGKGEESPTLAPKEASAVKEKGRGDHEKEKDDASPQESDIGKAEQTKKKEKEKSWGFFSPRHRGSLFPFSTIFTSTPRQKNTELHKIFTSLPESEKLVDDYSCALQRDILIHGRLYVTQNWLCFYANIFSWETLLTIPFQSVQALTKEKTALVIPNAIQISTTAEKYGFSSLMNRDATYNIVFKIWQNSLLNQPLSPIELVKAARRAWGETAEVGTEEELWGPSEQKEAEDQQSESKKMKKHASMPTHLELGLLPVPNVPPSTNSNADVVSIKVPVLESGADTDATNQSDDTITAVTGTPQNGTEVTRVTRSLPPKLEISPLEEGSHVQEGAHKTNIDGAQTAKTPNHTNGSDSRHINSPAHLHTDFPGAEKVSVGGESIASSEFETVSFTEEPGEIPCGCAEHIGRTIINEVYPTDVETIFQLLFTDSEFIRSFYKARKTINIEIGDWQPQPDGTKLRDVSFTLSLNYSFGPKFSPSTEFQVYSKMGQPGLKHIVDNEVINGNIPYSDTFFVSCRYCMTRVAHNKTRLRITANINFKKSCWGLVKSLIERNAGDGLRSYYNHMDTFLKEYLVTLPVKKKRTHRRGTRHNSRSRHRRPSSTVKPPSPAPVPPVREVSPPSPEGFRPKLTSTDSLKSFQMDFPDRGTQTPVPSEQQKQSSSHPLPRVNLALTLLLGILILSNIALYHHLMSYQTPGLLPSPSGLPASPQLPQTQTHIEWPNSREEWIAFVRQLLDGHEEERQKWHDSLGSLVEMLNEIGTSVNGAKKLLVDQLETNDAISDTREDQEDSDSGQSKKVLEPPTEHSRGKQEAKTEL